LTFAEFIVSMIRIAPDKFLMGSVHGNADESPVHEVTLNAFCIAMFTVTNSEFNEFLQSTGHSFFDQYLKNLDFNDPRQPVVGVSWFDAMEYCKWLSGNDAKTYRLPTEAEWEYAATSGRSENIYPWGKTGWQELPEFHVRFKTGPEKVGSFAPNAFGIQDMGINVHEWCLDWYRADYYQHSPASNPRGPETGTRRASRGGSWRHQIKITRCAARSSIPPDYRYADYGFRVVQEINS
jgi:formylglycine-generating enzyme required for sulfatase activity